MSQRAFDRAKVAVDKSLDQVRQTVHEKTAPKTKTSGAKTSGPSANQTRTKSSASKGTTPKTKTASSARAKKRGM